jgi:hypothetical protein
MDDQGQEAATLRKCGHATARGLRLHAGLRFEEWVCAGRQITKISSASTWWLGDWLLYGERSYGARYRDALELTPFDYKTLRNYAWVARRIEMSRRRDSLSFQHHAEVAALPEPEQELWLERAQTLQWSRNELRRQLKASRERSQDAGGLASIVLRMEIAPQRQQRWHEAASSCQQELTEWITATADRAAELALASTRRAQPPPVPTRRLERRSPDRRAHAPASP